MPDDHQEIDHDHKARAYRLMAEVNAPHETGAFLAAYQSVLLKDALWCLSELLTYKQNEVHR